MKEKIKTHVDMLTPSEKVYAGAVLPVYISFIIYLIIGVPILAP